MFRHYTHEKPVRPVIIARHTTAQVEHHRHGGDQISLGPAGVLDLDLSTQISLRDALTASIALQGEQKGGWAA